MDIKPNTVYFIASNAQRDHVLAVDDNGNVITTSHRFADGWEGWTFTYLDKNTFYIKSFRNDRTYYLGADEDGNMIAVDNKDKEGWRLEDAGGRVAFIVRNKNINQVLACDDSGRVCTTPNKWRDGWEGWVLEEERPAYYRANNSYHLVHNKMKDSQISIDEKGSIVSSSIANANDKQDLWILEFIYETNLFFIKNAANPSLALAIDDEGNVRTTENITMWDGWEGLRIEDAGHGIYFIVRNAAPHYVLAMDETGKIQTTHNKVAWGWEGWNLVSFENNNKCEIL